MAEENETPDMDKINEYIEGVTKAAFDKHKEDVIRAYEASRQATQQPDVTEQGRKQIREIIDPIYGNDIANAQLTSADAKDYTKFYRTNPDASDYEDKIEEVFENTKKQGRPLPRQEIYDYIVGKEFRTNPDEFTKKRQAKREKDLERAGAGADFASYESKAKVDPTWSKFDTLSIEDMEKALDGMTF